MDSAKRENFIIAYTRRKIWSYSQVKQMFNRALTKLKLSNGAILITASLCIWQRKAN
jgi:hypothetical protein